MDNKNLPNQNIDSNSGELLLFINKERLSKKINYKKVFRYFSKCVKKSITEMYNKFSELSNINEAIISGINMIYHIYFILINYTNNIKLTIFLLERAILLYTEFIIMSQDKKMVDEIYFIPNINDAVSFSFKKTIGPIMLNDIDLVMSKNNSVNFNVKFLKEISIVIRNIYKLYFRKKYINEESRFISLRIEENMETIDKLFQDKNILSEREIDEFKKYSALCAEQSLKSEFGLKHNYCNNDEVDSDEEILLNLKIRENIKGKGIKSSNIGINLDLNQFLNVINNEIVESLLNLCSNKKYLDIIKKINCILNSDDKLGNKLGKIKIIIFMLNKEYLYIENDNNKLLMKNEVYNLMKNMSEYLPAGSENIIINEFRERLFDNLVKFNFRNKFIHNIDENPTSLFIEIKNIELQLDEIFTFIK